MKKTMKIKMAIGLIAIIITSTIVLGTGNKKIATALSGMLESFAGEQEDNNIKINQEIEKYFDTEDTTFLQQKLEITEEQTQAKQESQRIEIDMPIMQDNLPNSVTILKNGKKLGEEAYSVNMESGKIDIQVEEQESATYKLIYEYSKIENKEQTIKLKTSVYLKLEEQAENQIADEKEINLQEQIGNNISYIEKAKSNIYKGNIYERKNETEYVQNYNLEVSETKDVENIQISGEANEKTYYKQTTLNKDNLIDIFGEDFEIQIKNDNKEVVAVLNKDSEADENGNIIINHENIKQIEIDCTKPINPGELKIRNNKAILADTGYTRNEIKNWASLDEKIIVNDNQVEVKNELKETTTQVKLEINKQDWATMTKNENIELGVTLESNNNTQDLYKNPTIKLEFPQGVEEIEVNNISKLYGDEFEVAKVYKAEENGKKYIFLQLKGEQTEYKEKAIGGTKIIINTNIILNKKITNNVDALKLMYTNEISNGYADEQGEKSLEISIVSPKEIIATNNISELGIETAGDEEVVDKELTRGDKQKTIKVESQIISNYDSKVKDVAIIGNFATDGKVTIGDEEKQNNIGAIVKSPVTIQGAENKNVQIYYTENSNPDTNLNDANNQWTQDLTSLKNPTKYLITISELSKNDILTSSYEEEIPANLQYNQQAFQGYSVLYTKEDSNENGIVDATTLNINTGKGPVIKAEIAANVNDIALNNGDTVKAGEEINYEIALKNVGTEQAKNVKVTMSVPENTKMKDDKSNEEIVETIDAGESKVVSYTVRVNEDLSSNENIIAKAKIDYNELSLETDELSNVIEPAKIVGSLHCALDIGTVRSGNTILYDLSVTNNTDTLQQNLTLEWNLPEYVEISIQAFKDETTGLDAVPLLENSKTINLPDLSARETKKIRLTVTIKDVEEGKKLAISANVKQGDEVYRIGKSEEKIVYCTTNFTRKLSANKENEYVKPGEEIDYKIEITNNNDENAYESNIYPISISDTIPNALTVLGVTVDGKEYNQEDVTDSRRIFVPVDSKVGETTTVIIKTMVDYKEQAESETITNKATMIAVNGTELETNSVSHIIERDKEDNGGDNNNGNNNGNQTNGKYEISGKVWVDENKDGEMGDTEETVQGIQVTLVDLKTNDYAKNTSGNTIEATTNNKGEYTLTNIPQGEYLAVFTYDSSRYTLTQYQKDGISSSKNSKVISKKITVGNLEKVYAVTDTIGITDRSVANINMGLIRAAEFDLRLDKYINKVIVQTANGSSVYSYDKTQLAKVEIDSKKLANANVTIEYKIIVSNMGEIDGYVRKVSDYLPSGFTFNSQENKNWYKQGDDLYNASLANEKIAVGQTKELTLKVSRKISANEMGTYTNIAEIADSYNEAGVTDINSTPGNKVKGENDMSQADLIISIKTGKALLYTMLIISLVLIMGMGVYEIKKRVLSEKD